MDRLERIELLILAIVDCLKETDTWFHYTTELERELAEQLEKEYRAAKK